MSVRPYAARLDFMSTWFGMRFAVGLTTLGVLGFGCSSSATPGESATSAQPPSANPDNAVPVDAPTAESPENAPATDEEEQVLLPAPEQESEPTPPTRPVAAECEPVRLTVSTPEPPIDFVLAVDIEGQHGVGQERLAELVSLIAERMRQPGNRDYLNIHIDRNFEPFDSIVDLEDRVALHQMPISATHSPRSTGIPNLPGYMLERAVLGGRLKLRSGASLQAISIRTTEPGNLFCWPSQGDCSTTTDQGASAQQQLDSLASIGWQAHLVVPSGDCDAADNPTPISDQLVAAHTGQHVDYCAPEAMQSFMDALIAGIATSTSSCQVALPHLTTQRAFDISQFNVSLSGTGDEATPLTLSSSADDALGCDEFKLNRPLSPDTVSLCAAACSGSPQELAVELTCDDSCERISAAAQVRSSPLDLVLAIDTSGSMNEEIGLVQQNLDAFLSLLHQSGVDMKLIVLAERQVAPPVAVDPGDGQFLSLDVGVASQNALDVLVDSYPDYAPHLRPGVPTHYLVITDDDVREVPNYVPQRSVEEFVADMTQRLGQDFVYHSVASPPDLPEACVGSHGEAASPAIQHARLSEVTGGTWQNICAEDWGPLFENLAQSLLVTVPLSCQFELPPPPESASYIASEVDLQLGILNDPQIYTVPGVDGAAACSDTGGWYFDDPEAPSSIHLCDSTCNFVGSAALPALEISLNCEIPNPVAPPIAR